jgi:tRNA A37 threonylcarbamoyladenosine biosynthesis protein TsaE
MYKKWSDKEIAELRDFYENKGLCCIEISKIMTSRTPISIHIKIDRLKLRHTKEQEISARSRIHIGPNNPMYV